MLLRFLRWVFFSNRRAIIVLAIVCAILLSLFPSSSSTTSSNRFPLVPYFHETETHPVSTSTPDNTQLRNALFPVPDPPHLTGGNVWIDDNNRQLKALFRCIQLDNCRPNQPKVIILHSHHFTGALLGWTGGEDLWARSTIQALKNMGYTFLYATEQTTRALQLYQLFPDLVIAVLMEAHAVHKCFQDTSGCLKSPHHLHGIPAWKIFSFYFWTEPNHPLGPRWTLSPENYTMEHPDRINNYLGYSVEPSCLSHEFIPSAERPKQGYVMAKKSSYLARRPDRPWKFEDFDKAVEETGIQLVSGLYFDGNGDQQPQSNVPVDALPKSVNNYGPLQQPQFITTLSNSRVLIGTGLPHASPTPYEALCLGVPFINPIVSWDPEDKMNRFKWGVQHGLLKFEDPPYVYNVFKGDQKGFVRAIKDALNTPIDRYILGRMTMKAVESRLGGILEHDWYKVAEDILAERVRKGEGMTWTM